MQHLQLNGTILGTYFYCSQNIPGVDLQQGA